MARGSSFWSTSRGKLGNMVLSVVRGIQVERAYQPKVLNPRTKRQMLQRATFASDVKLYKALNSGLFKFAYEDKGKRESDYNAFMRHNVQYALMANRKVNKRADIWPLEAYGARLSYGSLPAPEAGSFDGFAFLSELTAFALSLGTKVDGGTYGALSKIIIDKYGLQDGDILTMVVVKTNIERETSAIRDLFVKATSDALDKTFTSAIKYYQLVLDTASTETAADVLAQQGLSIKGEDISFLSAVLQADEMSLYACLGSVIFSRVQSGQTLKVSTSVLVSNVDDLPSMITDTDAINTILSSWSASDDAILEGSLA